MRIHYRIQHAAGRDEPLARLLSRMPPKTEIITDYEATTDPNPWRNYRRCLADPPEGATHLCVLQDDVVVCRNFGAVVERVVAARPEEIVSLFVGGAARKSASALLGNLAADIRWTQIGYEHVVHVVALVWPVAKATQFLAWSDTAKIPGYRGVPRSDDAILCAWLRATRQWIWATTPSLVEHLDDTPTLIHARERARDGADRGRIAVAWIGAEADPLALDWSA